MYFKHRLIIPDIAWQGGGEEFLAKSEYGRRSKGQTSLNPLTLISATVFLFAFFSLASHADS